MKRTNRVQTHGPSHLREDFQQWLDSYEPGRIEGMDIGGVASLLDALADCGDILPEGYCDQLEIPKGSTYAQAVADVRQFYAQQHGEDRKAFTPLRVEDFSFEQRPLSDLPEDDLSQWLADLGGNDRWSVLGEGVTGAAVVLGDHIILWQDRPLTDEDKRSGVAEYEVTAERHQMAEEAMRFLEEHGLTIKMGWRLNGNPPSDVREYLDDVIASCLPSSETITEEVIEMVECDLPEW